MKDTPADNKRLEDLEARIAFQDQTIDELNKVIVVLREQMDLLTAKVKSLSIQLSFDFANKDKDILPPHY